MHHRDKTHCVNGHEFTVDNTRHQVDSTTGKKWRKCKACEQHRNKRRQSAMYAYERNRVADWVRAQGYPILADRIERGDHIPKRGKRVVAELALARCRTQQQEQAS
jgi:hypothetical protein